MIHRPVHTHTPMKPDTIYSTQPLTMVCMNGRVVLRALLSIYLFSQAVEPPLQQSIVTGRPRSWRARTTAPPWGTGPASAVDFGKRDPRSAFPPPRLKSQHQRKAIVGLYLHLILSGGMICMYDTYLFFFTGVIVCCCNSSRVVYTKPSSTSPLT